MRIMCYYLYQHIMVDRLLSKFNICYNQNWKLHQHCINMLTTMRFALPLIMTHIMTSFYPNLKIAEAAVLATQSHGVLTCACDCVAKNACLPLPGEIKPPQTTQKPTAVPPNISVNNGRMGTFEVPILCACMVRRRIVCAVWTNVSFILGTAVPGEASETMVELCLWAIYHTSTKLAIYCDYLW